MTTNIFARFSMLCAITSCLTPMAFAQICDSPLGTSIPFLSAEDAYSDFSEKSLVKDEFETTAQFQERRRQVQQALNGSELVIEGTYDPEFVAYNADRQLFQVMTLAWDNLAFPVTGALGRQNSIGAVSGWSRDYAVALSQSDEATGQYEAQNGYGASTTVTKVNRTTIGVFDKSYKPADSLGRLPEEWQRDSYVTRWSDVLRENTNYEAVSFAVAPDEARMLKPDMRVAVVMRPKAPYFAEGSFTNSPTRSSPIELNWHVAALVGDIQCVVLTDKDGSLRKVAKPAPMPRQ